jgi:DNA mismatch endonuclease (patch repair protein)
MSDKLTPLQRSHHMRRIRKKDTGPEVIVRKLAHSLGYRFRLHRSDLQGTPDLVFPKQHKVIFVHGHQHGCNLSRLPKTRLDYWIPKFSRNKERDRSSTLKLIELGWQTFTVWECETRREPLECECRSHTKRYTKLRSPTLKPQKIFLCGQPVWLG